jgi:hypothetical protein
VPVLGSQRADGLLLALSEPDGECPVRELMSGSQPGALPAWKLPPED